MVEYASPYIRHWIYIRESVTNKQAGEHVSKKIRKWLTRVNGACLDMTYMMSRFAYTANHHYIAYRLPSISKTNKESNHETKCLTTKQQAPHTTSGPCILLKSRAESENTFENLSVRLSSLPFTLASPRNPDRKLIHRKLA